MKCSRIAAACAVFLCVATTAPVHAQRGDQGKSEGKHDKPQPQQRAEQPRQQQQQQRAEQPRQQQQQPRQHAQQPATQQRSQQARHAPPQRAPEQARRWQEQKGWVQKGGWQGHQSFEQNRAQNWASDHRTWAQRGGYGGYYIPQATFGRYFGSQHFFRIRTRPIIYMGYPRFSYGGFSFLMVDPWPEYWSDNWYYSDDVYVDYDDYDAGYYLYNRRYPEVRLAITVVM